MKEDNTPWLEVTGGYAKDMSLRDYIAAKAMQGLVACDIECGPENVPHIVESAYIMADSMLKAREQ